MARCRPIITREPDGSQNIPSVYLKESEKVVLKKHLKKARKGFPRLPSVGDRLERARVLMARRWVLRMNVNPKDFRFLSKQEIERLILVHAK